MTDLHLWQVAFRVVEDPALSQEQAIEELKRQDDARQQAQAEIQQGMKKALEEVATLRRELQESRQVKE